MPPFSLQKSRLSLLPQITRHPPRSLQARLQSLPKVLGKSLQLLGRRQPQPRRQPPAAPPP